MPSAGRNVDLYTADGHTAWLCWYRTATLVIIVHQIKLEMHTLRNSTAGYTVHSRIVVLNTD